MAENKPREMDTRETAARPTHWKQPDVLPEPDRQPGYAYRWIRSSTLGAADPRNMSAKLREGWEPVTIAEQPKFKFMTDANSRFTDGIEIGGLLLCKTPEEFVTQRTEHYQAQTHAQTEAVDNSYMRQSDPRMPLFKERNSTTTFGKGN